MNYIRDHSFYFEIRQLGVVDIRPFSLKDIIMKTFLRSFFILGILFIGSFGTLKASHISGGDITYTCVGQDSFMITLNLFRDCDGISAPASATVDFSSTCGGSATALLTKQPGFEISQLCPTQIPNSTCNGGNWPGMEQHTYTGIVVLSPPCNSWTMSWDACCRNQLIDNLTNPNTLSTYLYSTMYSGVDSCNNSPTFTSLPIPYVCMNQVVNYNFGVVEPDGDSIVYFMSPGYEDAANLVPYATPYTFNQPLPGANAVLNPFNGQLTFTPTATGVFVIVVRIEEYDINTGVIKSTSIRDVQVVVQNCSNLQPTIDSPGIYNFSGSGTQIDSNSVEVCVGDSFSFDVSISDPDTAQTLDLFHNIYSALDSSATVTITNGNPATLHVAWTAPAYSPSFTSFTITGIDDACPVVGIVSAVFNVYINPSTYAGPDKDICEGTQWVDLPVVGGTSFIWTSISGSFIDTIPTSPGFNMTCRQCDNPSVSPQQTTTYVVVSNLAGGCKNIDTVTVVVNPNFNITMPNDTIICPIDSINLFVNSDQPTFNYNYNWAPSATLTNDTIFNPTGFPTDPTNYRVTVEVPGGCTKTGNVFVDLSPPFPAGISIMGDTTICLGDSTMLTASLGDVAPSSCGLSSTPCIGNISVGTIGTGTQNTTGTSWPAPYGRFYWGVKHQFLFTAAELYAMGMATGGKITSLAFDVTQVGTNNTMNNLEIKMGCTSVSDLSGGWETGLVTVLPAANYTPIAGWNTHQFTNAYDWDGVSNVVVEMCSNNSDYSSASSSLTSYTPTTNVSVRYYRADNANVCASTNTTGTSSDRPNVQFEFCTGADPLGYTYSWIPSTNMDSSNIQTPLVYPNTTTTYNVVVQDSFGTCSDTVSHLLTLVTEFDAGFNIPDTVCFNGGIVTATPMIGGGLFTGTGIVDDTLGLFDPSIAGIGTFPINYWVASPTGNCVNDSTINITVIPSTDPSFITKEFCEFSSADTLIPVNPGGTWSGIGMQDPYSGIFNPTGLIPGDYPVTYTLTDPCVIDTTIMVRIVEPYSYSFNSNFFEICEGSTGDLNTNYTLSNNPLQGAGPILTTWSDNNGYVDTAGIFDATNVAPGDYIVVLSVTGMDGTCGLTDSMTVRVRPVDYATPVGDLAYCSDMTQARIFVTPWLFGAGVTFTQTPIAPLPATDTLIIYPYGQNGEFNAQARGIGQWEFITTYENVYGCVGMVTDTIHILDTPEKPVLDNVTFCEGDDIILSAQGANQDSLYWYGNFQLTDTIGIGNNLYYNVAPDPANGDIYVWVTQNNWACVSPKQEYKLPIMEAPIAAFNMDFKDTNDAQLVDVPHTSSPIFGFTPFLVNFKALNTTSSDTILWYHHAEKQPRINSESNFTNSANVSWNYFEPNMDKDKQLISGAIAYKNELVVINEFGCSDTTDVDIYSIASEQFYNVFTPNDDGKNDIFYVPVFGLTDYKVEIFNRWGKKVYEWNDPAAGWSGEDQPDGVYYYVVTGINNDSEKSEYKKQGSVTLTGSGK
ncbi:MAG: gliding motility-associated C-terminal domain-containing protein [Salibacteraceae bacterium]